MQTLGIKDNGDTISQRLLEHLQKQLMPSWPPIRPIPRRL
jgi:lipoyl(octanoyl) transferase